MNKSLQIIGTFSALLMASANALAAPNVVVGTNSIAAGQAAAITMSFQADGTVTSFDFKYTFDNTQFTATPSCVGSIDTTGAANANVACSVVGNEVRVLVSGAAAFPVPPITAGSQSLGSVSFQSLGSTPAAVYPLTVTSTNYFDTNSDPVTGTSSTNGSITVVGAVYASTPAPGALNVGSVQANGTDPFVNVVINNTSGGTGTTLTGTCSETSDPDGVFSLSGDTNFSVPKAGPNDTVTVTCDSAGSVATHNGTMSCSHNGTNTSPQLYNLSCTITPGPQASFSSNPAPGQIVLGSVPQGSAAPTQNISISNGGDVGTTLNGTCAFLAGDAQITLTSDGAFSVSQGGSADIQTVSCSTAAEGTYNRTLRCPHNGSNGPNADFPVQCIVGPPPAPKYTSNKALGSTLNFGGTTEQGDPNPTDTVSITNTGQTNSQLDVNCTDSSDPSNKFTVTNGVIDNLLPTGGAKVVTVTCDASAQGNYTGTLSCDHNDGTTTDPFTYNLDCKIGPPGGAVFASTPAPASTIQLTPSGAVITGTNVPTKPLTFYNNADPGDSDLRVSCGFTGGSPTAKAPFTVSPEVNAGNAIAPGGNFAVAFDCDTTNAGTFSAEFACIYDLQNVDPLDETVQAIDTDGTASYTVTCDVRNPETVVQPTPVSGTTLNGIVQPGGTVNFGVTFNETADEGVDPNDATLNYCEITGTDAGRFTILSPSFPQYIASGGSIPVQVQGSDDGSKQVYNATLECTYGDTSDQCEIDTVNGEVVAGESCETAEYPLVMTVGGDASFNVTKEFTDGANPTEVTVTISCNTGLPIIQSQEISETRDVTFIVQSFDTGEMNCTITENTGAEELNGYTPTYTGGPGELDNVGGCHFEEVDGGDEFTCAIVNDADPVPVEIEKLWVIDGSGGDLLDTRYKLTLYCNTEIVDGDKYCHGGYGEGTMGPAPEGSCKKFEGDSSQTFTAWVIPEWPSSNCWVNEKVFDDSVEIENGCGDLNISHGEGDSCLITNTVFYEGIPTLSQYGLAILALLMLGVGLVGFRRFA